MKVSKKGVTVRKLLGVPFVLTGVIFLKIYEFIADDKTAYRANEVRDIIYKSLATCTECEHTGTLESALSFTSDKKEA